MVYFTFLPCGIKRNFLSTCFFKVGFCAVWRADLCGSFIKSVFRRASTLPQWKETCGMLLDYPSSGGNTDNHNSLEHQFHPRLVCRRHSFLFHKQKYHQRQEFVLNYIHPLLHFFGLLFFLHLCQSGFSLRSSHLSRTIL